MGLRVALLDVEVLSGIYHLSMRHNLDGAASKCKMNGCSKGASQGCFASPVETVLPAWAC